MPNNKSIGAPKQRDLTLPIPETLEKVKGYNTLTIYKMAKSPYFYARLYEDGRIIRRSTKKVLKKDAIRVAEEFFIEIKSKKLNKEPLTRRSGFEVCALGLLKENKAKVKRGEIAAGKIKHDQTRLDKDLLPFFKSYELGEIDYKAINEYLATLNNEKTGRNLSASSIKIHLSHLKTILKYGQKMGVITSLPAFPVIKTVDNPRSWFSKNEYNKLHNTVRTHVGERFEIKSIAGEVIRTSVLTKELYDLILFMTNTFIRPTDIRVLKHKHIALVKNKEVYLRLSHPPTKGHSSPIVSMPKAIEVYEEIINRQKQEGYGKPDDFVFMPQHKENRDYAIQELHRQFDYALKLCDLKQSPAGEARTLYSLRHTAIMFRLIESEGLDLLSLARNARTSVEMIDRFYAKHLTAEMNVDLIQSNRSESLKKINQAIKKKVVGKTAQ